tara:strand:- start:178 stop:309 length:132 start_codon:yes stop_codon:yes gene_type:complete
MPYKEMPSISSSYSDQVRAKKLYEIIREIVRAELNESLERMKG